MRLAFSPAYPFASTGMFLVPRTPHRLGSSLVKVPPLAMTWNAPFRTRSPPVTLVTAKPASSH